MFEFWVRVEPNYSYPLKEFSLEKSEGFQSLFFYLNKPKYPNKKYSRQAVVGIIILTLLVAVKRGALPQDVFRI